MSKARNHEPVRLMNHFSHAAVAYVALLSAVVACGTREALGAAAELSSEHRLPILGERGQASVMRFPSTSTYASLNEIEVPKSDRDWDFEATHLDMAHGSDHFVGIKSRRPSLRFIKYRLLETIPVGAEHDALRTLCERVGLSGESAYLHYAEDTRIEVSGNTKAIRGWPSGTATAESDSRIQIFMWDRWRYVVNPSSPCAKRYLAERSVNDVATQPNGLRFDGIFIDEATVPDRLAGPLPKTVAGGRIAEYGNRTRDAVTAESLYTRELRQLYRDVRMAVASSREPGILYPNTASYVTRGVVDVALATDGVLTEVLSVEGQPYGGRGEEVLWDFARDIDKGGKIFIFTQGTAKPPTDLGYGPSNYRTAQERHDMYSLTSYWMARRSARTFYAMAPRWQPLASFWVKAQEADLGRPMGEPRIWKEDLVAGDEIGQGYRVSRREFERAIVVFRSRVDWNERNFRSYAAKTPPLPLGGCYQLLAADGSLGPPITTVQLALAEGAALMRCITPSPR